MAMKWFALFVTVLFLLIIPFSVSADFANEFKLLASDGQSSDFFGDEVAISGDTIIVGAYSDATSSLNGGSAYIFVYDEVTATWIEQQKLIPPTPYGNGSYGSAVAIEGDIALVGARGDGDQNADTPPLFSGAVYVYERTGDTWINVCRLAASDATERAGFGGSIAFSGNTAIVGGYKFGTSVAAGATKLGSAYIFTRDPATGCWTEEQKLQASDGVVGDGFGNSVSIDGDTVVIGAVLADGSQEDSGAAYIFTRSGDVWTQQQKIVPQDGAFRSFFGTSVSINGDLAIIGSYGSEDNAVISGSAYTFTRSEGVWSESQKLVPTDGLDYMRFGMDLSLDGNYLLVGAYNRDTSTTSHGAAYLFVRDLVTGAWVEQQKLRASDGGDYEYYGWSVSLSGDRLLIGAYGAAQSTGAAYVYSSALVELQNPDITVTPNTHDFGEVTIVTQSDQTITITNDGNQDLLLGNLGATAPLAAPFSMQNDTCTGKALTPAATCTFDIRFAPTGAGPFSDALDIPSNDPDEDPVIVNVSGTGTAIPVPDITVTDTVVPLDDLKVLFGSATAGNSTVQTVTVVNSGNADLILGTIATANPLAAPFGVENNACDEQTLAPAESCAFDVRFAPTATGLFNESFDIPSDDPDEDTVIVNVSGTGTAIPVPDITVTDTVVPLDDLKVLFGEVTEGLKTDQTVTLSNDGNADLILGTIAVANPIAEPFAILNDTCSGLTLPPATDCTFDVSFAPVDASLSRDSFDIPSDDPDEASLTVDLDGTGLSAETNNPPGKPQLVFPANGQEQLPTELTFQWRPVTDPDGDPVSYDVFYCTDLDPFQNCTAAQITSFNGQNIEGQPKGNVLYAGTGCGAVMLFFGFAFASRLGGRKRIALLIAMALAIGMLLTACNNHSNSNSDNENLTVTGLDSGTQYYWGVVAKDDQGGETQSEVWSFTTR